MVDWSYASLRNLSYADYERVLTSTKDKAKSKKRFLDLPTELRNQIYGYLMSPNLPDGSCPHPRLGSTPASTHFDITIMYTCRQVYREASHIFYRDHLFVRVRMSPPICVLLSFHKVDLEGTRRYNAEDCPRMFATIDIHDGDPTLQDFDRQNIVLACQEFYMLVFLLHGLKREYFKKLNIRIAIQNWFNVDTTIVEEQILNPLSGLSVVKSAFISHPTSEDLPVTFVDLRSTECSSAARQRFLASVLRSLRLMEYRLQWVGISKALYAARRTVEFVLYWEKEESPPVPSTIISVLKYQIEVIAYSVSLRLRNRVCTSQNVSGVPRELHRFRKCYQTLDKAQPSQRLLPLARAIEEYFSSVQQFRNKQYRAFYKGIQEVKKYDHDNKLGLGFREIFGLDNIHWPSLEERIRQLVDFNKSLEFAELDKLFTRLYQIAGI
ncbi:MAG: hypothetical protein Q9188_005988 [Gyalolechia gomerana]